eukprot:5214666-Amphidinium_carterae.3
MASSQSTTQSIPLGLFSDMELPMAVIWPSAIIAIRSESTSASWTSLLKLHQLYNFFAHASLVHEVCG